MGIGNLCSFPKSSGRWGSSRGYPILCRWGKGLYSVKRIVGEVGVKKSLGSIKNLERFTFV